MPVMKDFYCTNKKCEEFEKTVDGFVNEIIRCEKCNRKLKQSNLMNRTVTGYRDFRWVDER